MKYLVKFVIESDPEEIGQIVADMGSEVSYDGGNILEETTEAIK